jgi:mono/diheme cytochrome c family protein
MAPIPGEGAAFHHIETPTALSGDFMRRTIVILVWMASASAAAAPSMGDATHGARLYRLHCTGCHGPEGKGDGYLSRQLSPAPADLRNPALLFSRANQDLFNVISQGGLANKHSFLMPAHGDELGLLDVWDTVALLRQGQLTVDDFFPDAIRYAVKRYAIDDDGAKRVEKVLGGALASDERAVYVAGVYGKGRPPESQVIYVPQEPITLDTLKTKEKVGYVALFAIPAGDIVPSAPKAAPAKKGKAASAPIADPFAWKWETVPVAIAMDRDGVIKAIAVGGDAADRARAASALSSFAGQGGKRNEKRPDYKQLKIKGSDTLAKLVNRLYYRSLEGAIMYDKEEQERNWAE